MVLSFRVNALRSQVHRAEGQIVALKQQKMYLETEFETRANQQQLKAWNDLEFGYVAPTAGQYLENERQLAALSKPADPGAPAPIRVASVDDTVIAPAAFPNWLAPNCLAARRPRGWPGPKTALCASWPKPTRPSRSRMARMPGMQTLGRAARARSTMRRKRRPLPKSWARSTRSSAQGSGPQGSGARV
jgi:hypothetical protein